MTAIRRNVPLLVAGGLAAALLAGCTSAGDAGETCAEKARAAAKANNDGVANAEELIDEAVEAAERFADKQASTDSDLAAQVSGAAEALDARPRTESGKPTDTLVTDILNRVTVMCGGEIADF